MPTIAPYRALHYNPKMIADLSQVVIPPYDVISPGQAKGYLSRSPYNLAHVVLPKSANEDYSAAAALLQKWRDAGVLQPTPSASYYLYQQIFTVDGKTHTRNALLAAVLISEYAEGQVRPHENTHGKPKADRLNILKKTQTNLSHVFSVVKDPEQRLQSIFDQTMMHPPMLKTTTDDGVKQAVWAIDGAKAKSLESFFANEPVYIVDGHHRYEASLANARESKVIGDKSKPSAYMMFAICNAYDPSLLVFPTHRWVQAVDLAQIKKADVEKQFHLERATLKDLEGLVANPQKDPRFGLYCWGETYLATPRAWKSGGKATEDLAVTWSDDHLLKPFLGIQEQERSSRIVYEKSLLPLWEKKQPSDVIIFHAPPAIDQILNVADQRGFMPQKSTYFYPKLTAGFTLRSLGA